MTSTDDLSQEPPKRRANGQMKQDILAALSTAGEAGMSVKELSTSLSIHPANIHAWFFGTGKQMPEIKKVGRAKYRLEKEMQSNPVSI